MIMPSHINKQIELLLSQLDRQRSHARYRDVKKEVQERLATVGQLLGKGPIPDAGFDAEEGAYGPIPFGLLQIQFHITRCEAIVQQLNNVSYDFYCGAAYAKHLYDPSFSVTVIRRFFAILLRIRARIFGYEVQYNPPRVMDVLICSGWYGRLKNIFRKLNGRIKKLRS